MTREEAVKIFNTVLAFGRCDCQKEEIEECLRMAIKALKQEPCEDCISRELVLRELDKYLCGVPFDEKGIDEVIKDLPSVTPQPTRWIPIKTRPLTREEFEQYGGESSCEVEFAYDCPIPEDNEEVLITTDSGSVEMDTFYRDSLDGCFFESYYGEHDIVAWMPLPEAYKADKEENE